MMQLVSKSEKVKTFLDFYSKKGVFYSNLYFEDECAVAKVPISSSLGLYAGDFKEMILSEEFNLAEYTYLLSLTE